MESFYHGQYCFVHSDWYETFDQYTPSGELLSVIDATMPPTWSIKQGGHWIYVTPPDSKLPTQGWKIHISATPANCAAILQRTAEICRKRLVAFKFAGDRWLVTISAAKGWARQASGKAITIYPVDEIQFGELIEELYVALKEFDGPYILSDKRYKDAKVLYYRYGGIVPLQTGSITGGKRAMLRAPGGELVPDLRMPYWSPPDWVVDPFPSDASMDEGPGSLNQRYEIQSALSFSVNGGVYVALDVTTGEQVVIKEARPHTGIDPNGDDAVARLRKEYDVLKRLRGSGVAPEPIELFTEWEHLFLVEQFVPGPTLARLVVTLSPVAKGLGAEGEYPVFGELLRNVWRNLSLAIAAMHDRNIIYGDLSIRNVIVADEQTGAVKLLDFEGAWADGVHRPGPWFGTPGFRPPGGVSCKADDVYGLGAVMLGTLLPVNCLCALDPTAGPRFVEALGSELGLPERVRMLIIACLDQEAGRRPSTADIVEVLNHEFTARA